MKIEDLQNVDRDVLISRIIELECAIKWLVNDRMKNFDDRQYGKGNMRNILENGSLPVIEVENV